jgi:hypothetical protein
LIATEAEILLDIGRMAKVESPLRQSLARARSRRLRVSPGMAGGCRNRQCNRTRTEHFSAGEPLVDTSPLHGLEE